MANVDGNNNPNLIDASDGVTNGADSIRGFGGNDTIFGLGGNDTILGGNDNDTIDGGSGNDFIQGDGGNDTLFGGAGGNDTLLGGSGNDLLIGNDGADSLSGGSGNDTASYVGSNAAVTAAIGGVGVGGHAAGDTIGGDIENLIGSAFNDSLTGNGGANILTGSAGDDTLSGGDGNDTLIGGVDQDLLLGGAGNDNLQGDSGNDTLIGGAGSDTLAGGIGSDTADYSASGAAVNVNLGTGAASGGDAQGDALSSIENVIGSSGADTLTGSDGANAISGGDGNDTINGGLGGDLIDGGAGNDSIVAGPATGGTSSPSADLFLDWDAAGADEGAIANGYTQNAGGINVQVNFAPGLAGSSFTIEEGDTIYTEAGEPFDATTSSELRRPGAGEKTEMTMSFSAVAGSGYANEVQNAQFRISDIDQSNFIDQVTIFAYDALGNAVPVTITTSAAAGQLDIDGNTVTSIGGSTTPASANGSVLVEIAGPVAQIVIQYTDLDDATQAINVSNVHFETIPLAEGDNDTVLAGDGDDTVLGGIGEDSIDGGAGNDSLDGQDGDDTLLGGEGNDTLLGGAGDDSLVGGSGDDLLDGGIGNDTQLGGEGLDTIVGSEGADSIVGGTQQDTVDYSGSNEAVNVNLAAGTASGGYAEGDTLGSTDGIIGSAFDDTLIGFDQEGTTGPDIFTNVLIGGAGNDSIDGRGGDDVLDGGVGNDTIIAGQGADTVSGGDGRDTIIIANDPAFLPFGTIVDGGEGPVPGGTEDFDTLDLRAWGKLLTNIVYDPNNGENGIVEFLDANGDVIGTMNFSNIEDVIPCFTAGTLITTPAGLVPVETLRPGDLVLTRDNGARPVRWVGRRRLTAAELRDNPQLRPVTFAAGAMGGGLPARDLTVSPQHRMLIQSVDAELLFGEPEVLVPARHMAGRAGIATAAPAEVTYIHLLFDSHEIVLAEGMWSESFQPGIATMGDMAEAQRAEILTLFPELAAGDPAAAFPAARITLKAREVALIA